MPRAGIGELPRVRVQLPKEQRDKVIRVRFLQQKAVGEGQYFADIAGHPRDGSQEGPYRRHEQCGAKPVPGDIADNDRVAHPGQGDVIVVVAAGKLGGKRRPSNVEALDGRRILRKKLFLDVLRRDHLGFSFPQCLLGFHASLDLASQLPCAEKDGAKSKKPHASVTCDAAQHFRPFQRPKGSKRHRDANPAAKLAHAVSALGMTLQTGPLDDQRPHGLKERRSANTPFGTDLPFTLGQTLEGIRFPRIGGVRGMPRLQADQMGPQLGLFMPEPVNLADHVASLHRHQPLSRAHTAYGFRPVSRCRCRGGNKNSAAGCVPPQQAAILAKRALRLRPQDLPCSVPLVGQRPRKRNREGGRPQYRQSPNVISQPNRPGLSSLTRVHGVQPLSQRLRFFAA